MPGNALFNVSSLVMSADGRNVYALAPKYGVAVLRRDPGSGTLSQLKGMAGCVGTQPSCAVATAMDDPEAIALSPEGRNLYVVSTSSDSVAAFARDPSTGALRQLAGAQGCVAEPSGDEETGTPLACVQVRALQQPSALAVSPDGRNVYVGGYEEVAVFARDPASGALSQDGKPSACLSSPVLSDLIPCTPANALGESTQVTVSPSGDSVLVSAYPVVTEAGIDNAVALLQRNPNSGELTQAADAAGCVSDLGGACVKARGLKTDTTLPFDSNNLAISPDSRSVYLTTIASGAASGTISVFTRSTTRRLTQLAGTFGCAGVRADGCAPARAIQGVSSAAVSPDGRNLYATSYWDDAVAVFSRATTSTELTASLTPVGRSGSPLSGTARLTLSAATLCWKVALGGVRPTTASLRRRTSGGPLLTFRPPTQGCAELPRTLANAVLVSPASYVVEAAAGKSMLRGPLRVAR